MEKNIRLREKNGLPPQKVNDIAKTNVKAIDKTKKHMTEEERKKFGTLISGWLADLGMAFVAFGNLWEGILYFDRIYEIQNGHLLEIHNTREGKG